jgi:hypothetical protein
MTFGIVALSITSFSVAALSLKDLSVTLRIKKTVIMLTAVMLSVTFYLLSCWIACWVSLFIYCYAECCYAECRYPESRNAEFWYAESRYAECRCIECRYTECVVKPIIHPTWMFFFGMIYPGKSYWRGRLSTVDHSSLLLTLINYDRKKFHNTELWLMFYALVANIKMC